MILTVTKTPSRRTAQINIKYDDENYLECNVLYIFMFNADKLYLYYNV